MQDPKLRMRKQHTEFEGPHCTKPPAGLFKKVKFKKHKDRLRGSSRLKEAKGTGQLNAAGGPGTGKPVDIRRRSWDS